MKIKMFRLFLILAMYLTSCAQHKMNLKEENFDNIDLNIAVLDSNPTLEDSIIKFKILIANNSNSILKISLDGLDKENKDLSPYPSWKFQFVFNKKDTAIGPISEDLVNWDIMPKPNYKKLNPNDTLLNIYEFNMRIFYTKKFKDKFLISNNPFIDCTVKLIYNDLKKKIKGESNLVKISLLK